MSTLPTRVDLLHRLISACTQSEQDNGPSREPKGKQSKGGNPTLCADRTKQRIGRKYERWSQVPLLGRLFGDK